MAKQVREFDHNWGWIANKTSDSGKSNGGASNNHNARYLANTPELYEIQRRNNFELTIPFSPTNSADYSAQVSGKSTSALRRWDADNGASGNPSDNYIAGATQKLTLSVSSVSVPSLSQDVIKIRRGNTELKFAGVPSWGDGTLTCNDYIGAGTYDILASWQAQSYNQATERVGLAEDYKKTATLTMYSPDYQAVRKYILHGVWLSSLSTDSLDYESGGKMSISASFVFDYAELA